MAAKKTAAPAQEEIPTTTAVTTTQTGGLPAALMSSMQQHAGKGMATTVEDFALPFLTILQQLSPELNPQDGAYIAGAKQGQILNKVTGELWEPNEGVLLVPVAYKREFIEWKPRKAGGGLVKVHPVDSDILSHTTRNDRNEDILPNGNYVVDTRTHFCLLVDEGSMFIDRIVMPFKMTQAKKSKNWNSKMASRKGTGPNGQKFDLPSFACVYRATAVPESNESGHWWGWKIEFAGAVEGLCNDESILLSEDVFNAALKLNEAVDQGEVSAKYEEDIPSGTSAQPSQAPGGKTPF